MDDLGSEEVDDTLSIVNVQENEEWKNSWGKTSFQEQILEN